jgi:hypothetical protein
MYVATVNNVLQQLEPSFHLRGNTTQCRSRYGVEQHDSRAQVRENRPDGGQLEEHFLRYYVRTSHWGLIVPAGLIVAQRFLVGPD